MKKIKKNISLALLLFLTITTKVFALESGNLSNSTAGLVNEGFTISSKTKEVSHEDYKKIQEYIDSIDNFENKSKNPYKSFTYLFNEGEVEVTYSIMNSEIYSTALVSFSFKDKSGLEKADLESFVSSSLKPLFESFKGSLTLLDEIQDLFKSLKNENKSLKKELKDGDIDISIDVPSKSRSFISILFKKNNKADFGAEELIKKFEGEGKKVSRIAYTINSDDKKGNSFLYRSDFDFSLDEPLNYISINGSFDEEGFDIGYLDTLLSKMPEEIKEDKEILLKELKAKIDNLNFSGEVLMDGDYKFKVLKIDEVTRNVIAIKIDFILDKNFNLVKKY